MEDNTLTGYLALAQSHPQLFQNPDQEGYTILLKEDEIREVEALVAERLDKKKLPVTWARVGIVYQGRKCLILRDAVRFPNGFLHTYIRFVSMEDTAGVAVLPLYQGKVLLVKRFQHATRKWHLKIPQRYGTTGLSAEENAQKMLAEDFGVTASHLVSLGRVQPGAGIGINHDELFLAYIEPCEIAILSGTSVETISASIAEFEQQISENVITDGFTIVAYTQAKIRGLC